MNHIEVLIQRGADMETLKELVETLADYAYRHFHHEEREMACRQCPARHANCEAHRKFIEQLQTWVSLMNTVPVPRSMIADLHAESASWIASHLALIDAQLAQHPAAEPQHASQSA